MLGVCSGGEDQAYPFFPLFAVEAVLLTSYLYISTLALARQVYRRVNQQAGVGCLFFSKRAIM